MPTFRVRQRITYYTESFIEAPNRDALMDVLFDLKEENQFALDEHSSDGPDESIDLPDIEESAHEPALKLVGSKLKPVQRRCR